MANISNRKFGIEIECFGVSRNTVAAALNTAGIRCQTQHYNHNTISFWKIVDDGSVRDGFELVSPPLSGQDGLKEVERVLNVMSSLGVRVDNRCGFHVHVDASGLNARDLMNIVRRYSKFEDKIDMIMPEARRRNNNSYCQSMRNFLTRYTALNSAAERATDVNDFVRNISDRYYKVNLTSFHRHGTVEFRQHSGTINATKAINWIVFCVMLVETTKQNDVVETATQPVGTVTATQTRNVTLTRAAAQRFSTMINMFTQGATVEAVAAATGWSASTVRTYLSSRVREMGYRVRTNSYTGIITITPTIDNVGQVIMARRGSRRAAPAAAPVIRRNPTDIDPFTGLDPEIISYFAERATDFGYTFA